MDLRGGEGRKELVEEEDSTNREVVRAVSEVGS